MRRLGPSFFLRIVATLSEIDISGAMSKTATCSVRVSGSDLLIWLDVGNRNWLDYERFCWTGNPELAGLPCRGGGSRFSSGSRFRPSGRRGRCARNDRMVKKPSLARPLSASFSFRLLPANDRTGGWSSVGLVRVSSRGLAARRLDLRTFGISVRRISRESICGALLSFPSRAMHIGSCRPPRSSPTHLRSGVRHNHFALKAAQRTVPKTCASAVYIPGRRALGVGPSVGRD